MKKTHHPNPISSLRPTQMPEIKPIKRPQFLQGFTEVIKTGYGNLYVTINTYDGRPFEVFVQIGKSGYSTMADAEATGRLVSLALRSGISVKDVVEQLEGIGGIVPGFLGREARDVDTGCNRDCFKETLRPGMRRTFAESAKRTVDLNLERCPDCGDRALAFEQGCMTCRSCGFSKCD